MTGESDTMSHNSVQGYLEECFTEAVFAAAQLKTEVWGNRGNPEAKLTVFYKAFLQLHSMTFYRLEQKGYKPESDLQKSARVWFEYALPKENLKERSDMVRKFSFEGLKLFNEWSVAVQKHSIIKVSE